MDEKDILLKRMLSKVGDLGLKRRVCTLLGYLDITEGDLVLDCGCGEGFYTMIISELYNAQIVAFDSDAELLGKAAAWIGNKDKVMFINGDITDGLPFENGAFDKVIFSEVLEHLDEDAKAMTEVYRVLKPGGVVGLTVPNKNYPLSWDPLNWARERAGLGHFDPRNTVLGGVWSYDHKRLYSSDGIRGLAEALGFRVSKIETLTHYCLPFNYHILRLGKLFYTRFPVSPKTKEAMEKFEWKKADSSNKKFQLVEAIFDLFKWVDSKNDRITDLTTPSVSLSLRLEK